MAAALLVISLFVPIWNIFLDAPQYPEGLGLQIWAHKIAGDVDIINGLNHYIGMKTLHTEDFIEFRILPYLISGFALFFVAIAVIGRRKTLFGALIAFVLFGITAMVDFWKWEYDYGHNLDPDAAIQVPGMAYQPPLIGFKQLLNFGAYSIPAAGGWFFVAAGILLLWAVILENRRWKKSQVMALAALAGMAMFWSSCGSNGPESINLNKDDCDFCKMSISEGRFAAEVVTTKGRVYKFDDLSCLFRFAAAQEPGHIGKYYAGNFKADNELLDATTAWFVRHESLRSPMGGNIAAFPTRAAAEEYGTLHQTPVMGWDDLRREARAEEGNHHDHQ